MITLALDLGTKTGYALGDTRLDFPEAVGTYALASDKILKEQRKQGGERTRDIRYQNLYQFIAETIKKHEVERIVFEDVLFLSSQAQAQLWASLRAAIWHFSITHPQLDIQCVPVGTLKKFATGNGGADKPLMEKFLLSHPLFPKNPLKPNVVSWFGDKIDDNAVDAVWLFYYSKHMNQGGLPWTSIWDNREARKRDQKEKKKRKKELSKLREK